MKKLELNTTKEILRVKNSGPREPLISFFELCDKYNLSRGVLGGLIRDKNGPEPVFRQVGKNTTSNRWYKPKEFHSWWLSINS